MHAFRVPSIGVEEEYQLVSPSNGELSPIGQAVLRHAKSHCESVIQHELHLEQIEMASPILNASSEVRGCLTNARQALYEAARRNGAALLAAGTNPVRLPNRVFITPKQRYVDMEREYQALARDLMIFGCHVHVDMPDRGLGVQVLDYVRPWLPLLQAMSANSPFWNGEDTGYASYRREMWNQWPMSDTPPYFQDLEDYEQCMQSLIQSGAIEDETRIYWDVRLPKQTPTLEFRVCDVQTEIEDCVALVAIMRALVMRCELLARTQQPIPSPRHELLRAAIWRAARYGLSATLIDPWECTQIEALDHLRQLFDYIAQPLDLTGDTDLVASYLTRLEQQGTPAERQKKCFYEAGKDFSSLVKDLIDRTVTSVPEQLADLSNAKLSKTMPAPDAKDYLPKGWGWTRVLA